MKKVLNFLRSGFNSIISDGNITVFSAYASFYMIISFVPFLIMILMIAGNFIELTVEDFVDFVGHSLPKSVIEFISSVVNEILSEKSLSIISLPVIALVWSASRSVVAIIRGLDNIYSVKENRGVIKLNLYGLFYTVIFFVAIFFSLIIMVFGNVLGNIIGQFFPFAINIIDTIMSTRAIVSLVFLTALFSCIYTFLPGRKLKFVRQIPGAVFSASGWMIFSLLFSIYFDNFSNKFYLYGSLTALILFMLWIYFCMIIIFIGGKINFFLLKEKNLL